MNALEIYNLPCPGDCVFALKQMRAWESTFIRGIAISWVMNGNIGLVIQCWTEGNQVRLQLFTNNQFLMFSCKAHRFHLNWKIQKTPVTSP